MFHKQPCALGFDQDPGFLEASCPKCVFSTVVFVYTVAVKKFLIFNNACPPLQVTASLRGIGQAGALAACKLHRQLVRASGRSTLIVWNVSWCQGPAVETCHGRIANSTRVCVCVSVWCVLCMRSDVCDRPWFPYLQGACCDSRCSSRNVQTLPGGGVTAKLAMFIKATASLAIIV